MAYSAYLQSEVVGFVTKYGSYIGKAIADTGLFFPAVVGQMCNESAYGKSTLASVYNNFGGVRFYGQDGATSVMLVGTGDSAPAPYCWWPTAQAGIQAYINNLLRPLYTQAGVTTASSPEQQIIRTIQAGYDPTSTPSGYLSGCQGAIDCARDVYKKGRISTSPISNYVSTVNPNPFAI